MALWRRSNEIKKRTYIIIIWEFNSIQNKLKPPSTLHTAAAAGRNDSCQTTQKR